MYVPLLVSVRHAGLLLLTNQNTWTVVAVHASTTQHDIHEQMSILRSN